MDVRPVGGGLPGTDLTRGVSPVAPAPKVAGAGPPAAAQPGVSIDAALLNALSEPDLARLVTTLQPVQSTQDAARLNELVQAVMTAAAAGDVARTLQGVAQLAAPDPLRAEGIRNEPGLEALRPQVDSLLARLANVSKLDAESRLAQAGQMVSEGRVTALPEWDARPETLLLIGNRLLEAGGHINSVRAAQVAQVVIDGARWAPAAGAVPESSVSETRGPSEVEGVSRNPIALQLRRSWTVLRKQAPARLAALWRRAPLLWLLLVWLAVGTAGGLAAWAQRKLWPDALPEALIDAGFSVWGLGFLALVLFGFYMRVRNVRL